MYKRTPGKGPAEQQVSPMPDVTVVPRADTDMLIVIACDGIWDVMTNEQCADFLLTNMRNGHTLSKCNELLLHQCLENNSRDNMSVVTIALPGAPKEIGTRKPEPPARTPPASPSGAPPASST